MSRAMTEDEAAEYALEELWYARARQTRRPCPDCGLVYSHQPNCPGDDSRGDETNECEECGELRPGCACGREYMDEQLTDDGSTDTDIIAGRPDQPEGTGAGTAAPVRPATPF